VGGGGGRGRNGADWKQLCLFVKFAGKKNARNINEMTLRSTLLPVYWCAVRVREYLCCV